MNKIFNTMVNLNEIITVFFPKLKIEKLEFNEKNAKTLLYKLIHIVDAIIKAENLYKKRNIYLIEKDYWLNPSPVRALERIALYIRKFDALSFTMSKTDRQTFIFVIENIIDYLKQDRAAIGKLDKKKIFNEYRFWVENFFKLLEQKISGDIEKMKTSVGDSIQGYGDIENYFYSNSKINIPLFPFAFNLDSKLFFTSGITNQGVLLYNETMNDDVIVQYSDLDRSLFEFFILNLRLFDGDILKNRIKVSVDVFLDSFENINTSLIYSNEKQYQKSYELLNSIAFDKLDHPLLYLFQIRNLAYLNKVFETKQLLERFINLFPYYSEGYELMGDIFSKEENFDFALIQYKKSLAIFQNKVIAEKIKKCSSLIKSREEAKRKNKDESFFNISEEVIKNEPNIQFRNKELVQLIEILSSASKRNVLLIGESGVGKSSLIKYLAQKIINNDVPASLLKNTVKEINFVSLLTGSKYRGQFEEKSLKLLQDLKGTKTILILEDIHLMMTSGAARGTSLDFLNIIKPFLRDGSVQIIATTNNEEFKNTIERDNSLLGYFQKVNINQMSESQTEEILLNRAEQLSLDKSVIIPENIITEIVKASKTNIRNRALPDSAVMLLERCVSKKVYKNFSLNNYEPELTLDLLSEVLSDMLNLPESFLALSIRERLSGLEETLSDKIKGQNEALKKVAKGVITSKLGFEINENRPDGVFLFVGPTGVGKTETAISLAKALYGSEDYIIRLDMSEYMEKFTYSRFVGAAPGYVGYNDSNQLTDKVRQNPFSVILIDEVEKGDRQLLNIFLQIFDAGRLTDARGNVVDFSNTTIIMTSNIGTNLYSKVQLGYQSENTDKIVSKSALNKSLKKFFAPEFLNRIDDIIVFNQLDKKSIKEIIRGQLDIIEKKLIKSNKELLVEDEVIDLIANNGYSKEYGARNISREIKRGILEKMAELSLSNEWGFCDTVLCTIEHDEIIIKLLNSGIQVDIKTNENMEILNA